MKVAFYGNNLNHGYFFVKGLRELGIEARVFAPPSTFPQEGHDWWQNSSPEHQLIRRVDLKYDPFSSVTPKDHPQIRDLYQEISTYDVLIMMEDGPSIFSDFHSIPKVFFSQGADLQITPFLVRYYEGQKWSLAWIGNRIRRMFNAELEKKYRMEHPAWQRTQERQREGIRQCRYVICAPYQGPLASEIGIPQIKIVNLPIMMHTSYLKESVSSQHLRDAESEFEPFDRVFFHPTRQVYLRLNHDMFLKDNDKLIRGYAKYIQCSKIKSVLVMVEKGRSQDLENSKRLVRSLGLEKHVRWIQELPNTKLKAYFNLDKVVVCDQFNPKLASLGNIGRESSFFGRPLVTAFNECNRNIFGEDMPPHVFPAATHSEIAEAMKALEIKSRSDLLSMKTRSQDWFGRQCDYLRVIPKYIEVLKRTI